MAPRSSVSRHKGLFFHAEDGIRAPLVTGVQTCALPISRPAQYRAPRTRLASSLHIIWPVRGQNRPVSCTLWSAIVTGCKRLAGFGDPQHDLHLWLFRSEERRVGKECRCRGEREDERGDG